MVTLINKEKHIQVFNLPAPAGVEDPFGSDIEVRTIEDMGDGHRGVKLGQQHIPGSITLLAGCKSDPLPDWVVSCPEVKAALDRGAIKLIQE